MKYRDQELSFTEIFWRTVTGLLILTLFGFVVCCGATIGILIWGAAITIWPYILAGLTYIVSHPISIAWAFVAMAVLLVAFILGDDIERVEQKQKLERIEERKKRNW